MMRNQLSCICSHFFVRAAWTKDEKANLLGRNPLDIKPKYRGLIMIGLVAWQQTMGQPLHPCHPLSSRASTTRVWGSSLPWGFCDHRQSFNLNYQECNMCWARKWKATGLSSHIWLHGYCSHLINQAGT